MGPVRPASAQRHQPGDPKQIRGIATLAADAFLKLWGTGRKPKKLAGPNAKKKK